MLGGVFQVNGQAPLKDQALKWDYSKHDIERAARRYNIGWRLPESFPIATQSAGRAFYWIEENDAEIAKQFALFVYQKYFVEGIDIRSKNIVWIAYGFGDASGILTKGGLRIQYGVWTSDTNNH